jgi:hypothetical protein
MGFEMGYAPACLPFLFTEFCQKLFITLLNKMLTKYFSHLPPCCRKSKRVPILAIKFLFNWRMGLKQQCHEAVIAATHLQTAAVACGGDKCTQSTRNSAWIIMLILILISILVSIILFQFVQAARMDQWLLIPSISNDHNSSPLQQSIRYTLALATLRCFTTPGCFPSTKCCTGHPQMLQWSRPWEEQAF